MTVINDVNLQAINDQTEFCDRKAMCQLMPFYEDLRKFFTWPDVQLTSGFFEVFFDFGEVEEGDLPAWFYLSSDPNTYQMPLLPMLNEEGEIAGPEDVTVYLNGLKVDDAVSELDPWNGVVSLNFIPPFNSSIRIDYYHSKRFPNPEFYLEEIVSNAEQAQENDVIGQFNIIGESGVVKRLYWPFEVSDPALYGDDRDYQVDRFPILNQMGDLAAKEDVTVSVGSGIAFGSVEVVSIVESGPDTGTVLRNIDGDWTNVEDGDTIILKVPNYLDNTLIYNIESVDHVADTIKIPNIIPPLADTYNSRIVRFVEVENAVESVRPILGHIRINFLPPLNTVVRFNYHHSKYERNYLMLPDAPASEDPFWEYGASDYTGDTFFGSRARYSLIPDQAGVEFRSPFWPWEELLKIGYRYRVFNLSNSSVLNSEETFRLNEYDKYTHKASFKNHGHVLNEFNLMFSPEYLEDTDKNIILNDKYLYKDIPAATIMQPGVPLFVETFTDDGHFKVAHPAIEEDTYDPDFPGGVDLPASFSIIDPDKSGLVDHNRVCAYEDNLKINLHSDLKIVEFPNGGFDAPLSSIDEGGSVIPFKFTMIDQYYPNREQRLTDYLDYINQVPSEFKTGTIKILNQSAIVKSRDTHFKALRAGDEFLIKNVPFVEWDETLQENVTVYRDIQHVLLQSIDVETGRIHPQFEGPSGWYDFELTRNKVYNVDVRLVDVQRTLVLNGEIGYTYGLPETFLQALPGYGDTGAHYELYFRDPDPDPYPRNPDNPWISNPDVSYYDIEEEIIDGKISRTNRILGVTGIVNTSQIVDADGMSWGETGLVAGVTGPSGALDLGITGPVDVANPRIVEDFDVYQVPSGDSGMFFSYSEAEYRVQWRNWDQEMFIVSIGDRGVFEEEPLNMMDDIGDGIKKNYWNVNSASIEKIYFNGTVLETSEKVSNSVAAIDYAEGVIILTQEQADAVNAAGDPVVDLPDLHLGDANYQLNRRIVREILHDNSIKVTEIREYVPL